MVKTKYDRMFNRKNQDILSSHYKKVVDHEGDLAKVDDGDEFLTIKRVDHELEDFSEVCVSLLKMSLR